MLGFQLKIPPVCLTEDCTGTVQFICWQAPPSQLSPLCLCVCKIQAKKFNCELGSAMQGGMRHTGHGSCQVKINIGRFNCAMNFQKLTKVITLISLDVDMDKPGCIAQKDTSNEKFLTKDAH